MPKSESTKGEPNTDKLATKKRIDTATGTNIKLVTHKETINESKTKDIESDVKKTKFDRQ